MRGDDDDEELCRCRFSLAYGPKVLLSSIELWLKRGFRYGFPAPLHVRQYHTHVLKREAPLSRFTSPGSAAQGGIIWALRRRSNNVLRASMRPWPNMRKLPTHARNIGVHRLRKMLNGKTFWGKIHLKNG